MTGTILRESLLRENDMLTVRRATNKDADKIMDLLEQVLLVHHDIRPDLFRDNGYKYTKEELLSMLPDDKAPIFVCVDEEDNVLGHAFCMIKEILGRPHHYDYRYLYIDDICVDKDKRRMNVGRLLYEQCVSFAKEQQLSSIRLNVWEGNGNAQKFYENMGMKPLSATMEQIL